MKQSELQLIMDRHVKWLRSEEGGERADLESLAKSLLVEAIDTELIRRTKEAGEYEERMKPQSEGKK